MKRKLIKSGLAALGVLLALTACASPAAKPVTMEKRQAAAASLDPRVVNASNGFGLNVYRKLAQAGQNKTNVFISPVSISLALSMAYNGSGGETRDAMAKTMGLQDMTAEEINQGVKKLLSLLAQPGKGIQLDIANSIWTRKGKSYNDSFLSANKSFYNATVTDLDFGDPKSLTAINDWVKQKTQGKIPKIVNQLSPDDMMVLINAVYFKGGWKKEFDPAETQTNPFKLQDGNTRNVPQMMQSGSFDYLQETGFQAVRLPYGEGQMDMLVVLPAESSDLGTLQEKLQSDSSRLQKPFAEKRGTVRLPRFKIEYGAQLNDSLKALGMNVAFDPNKADFSGMAPPPPNFYISLVQHKTFVEVNEKGTEAAAATAITMTAGAAPQEPFQFNANRPFFFAIEDRQTGAWLFMGSVVEP